MKKITTIIMAFSILLFFSISVSANEYYGYRKYTRTEQLSCSTYKKHSSFSQIDINYETINTTKELEYDYLYNSIIEFDCTPYSQYLILPQRECGVNFYNSNYGEDTFNMHHNYDQTTNKELYLNNANATFVSEDSFSCISNIIINDSDWYDFLDAEDGFILYDKSEYQISKGVILQSQNVSKVSLEALCFENTNKLIICRLYDEDFTNTIYKNQDPYLIVNASKANSQKELLSKINVSDNYDTNVSDSLKIVDTNYSPTDSKITLGDYYMLVSAEDLSGNLTTQKIFIRAADYTNPVITGSKTKEQSCGQRLDLASYARTDLVATDDYDGTLTNITVKTDGYSSNYNKLGNYDVVFLAVDSSGNEATHTLTITVKDNTKPSIIIKNVTSRSVNDGLASKDDIISLFTIYDQIDANPTIELQGYDNYKDNYQTIGSYEMKITVTDASGNQNYIDFMFVVYDDEKPTISIDANSANIIVQSGTTITQEDVIELIKSNTNNVSNIVSVSSMYFSNEEPSGDYDLYVTYEDGSVELYTITVESANINNDYTVIIAVCIAGGVLLLIGGKFCFDKIKRKKNETAE